MYQYIIIDDEELTRKGTIKKLEGLKDFVSCAGEAGNGEEGLRKIKELNPDIIITDMQMPIMDGTSLLPKLTELYPKKHIIVISGFKDFSYAKHAIDAHAIDYILKPFGKDEIQSAVNKVIRMLQDSSILTDQLTLSEEEREQTCYEYDIQTLNSLILGLQTKAVSLTSKRLSFTNDTHNLIMITIHSTNELNRSLLENYLYENGFGDLALYLQHVQNKNIGFIILFIPEDSPIMPAQYCKQIVKNIVSNFSTDRQTFSFGISNTHDSINQLHIAFEETVAALNSKAISSINPFAVFSEEQKSITMPFRLDKLDIFMFRLECGMKEETIQLLKEIFSFFRKRENTTIGEVKYICFQLADAARQIVTSYFEHSSSSSGFSSIQNIFNTMYSLEEIEAYYYQFFTNICDMLVENNVYATENIINQMKLYVERNYEKNLSLELISSLFNMSRSYCSHSFKKTVGVNFVDYINDIRIEKACDLLSSSDRKMYQIARAVGYDNVKYFFRIFKKKKGMTPEQYKETFLLDS